MTRSIHVGVLGLGSRWRKRYRAALLAPGSGFRVAAVCDAIEMRAQREARRLGCAAAAGPTELLETPGLDAFLLLDPHWFGLWPLERACAQGKPVLCGGGLERDAAHVEAVRRQVQASRLPVLMDLTPRLMPAMDQLRHLLQTHLGAPRLVLCDDARPWRGGTPAAGGPEVPPPPVPLALLDACASLFDGTPASVLATGLPGSTLASLQVEFAEGRGFVIRCYRAAVVRRSVRLVVETDRGVVEAVWPHQLAWTEAEGRYSLQLRSVRPLTQPLLDRLARVVRQEQGPEPSFDDAYRAWTWLRAAGRSQHEGRRVPLPAERDQLALP